MQCFSAHLLAPKVPASFIAKQKEVYFSLPILEDWLLSNIEQKLLEGPAVESKQTRSAHSSAPYYPLSSYFKQLEVYFSLPTRSGTE